MTQIAPRDFYDDVDNFHEIRVALKRKRYAKSFKYLYTLFYNGHQNFVTTLMLQESLCISDRSTSYQILSSLAVLNLLEKKKMGPRKILFIPLNKSWWVIFHQEMGSGEPD